MFDVIRWEELPISISPLQLKQVRRPYLIAIRMVLARSYCAGSYSRCQDILSFTLPFTLRSTVGSGGDALQRYLTLYFGRAFRTPVRLPQLCFKGDLVAI